MREVYQHEFNATQRLFAKLTGMWRINKDSIDFTWGYFAPTWGFKLSLSGGSYFYPRYSVTICLIWGLLRFSLPFKARLKEGDRLPMLGIEIYNGILWIQYSDKCLTWYLPFFTWNFDGHWMKGKLNQWVLIGKNLDSWYFKKDQAFEYEADFEYRLNSGELQQRTAKFYEEKRQWGRKWFPFSKMIQHTISVDFSDEVGVRSGTWKGGTVGCIYEIKKGETPEQCFKRMMLERTF